MACSGGSHRRPTRPLRQRPARLTQHKQPLGARSAAGRPDSDAAPRSAPPPRTHLAAPPRRRRRGVCAREGRRGGWPVAILRLIVDRHNRSLAGHHSDCRNRSTFSAANGFSTSCAHSHVLTRCWERHQLAHSDLVTRCRSRRLQRQGNHRQIF